MTPCPTCHRAAYSEHRYVRKARKPPAICLCDPRHHAHFVGHPLADRGPSPVDGWLSLAEAAVVFGVSVGVVRERIQRHGLVTRVWIERAAVGHVERWLVKAPPPDREQEAEPGTVGPC